MLTNLIKIGALIHVPGNRRNQNKITQKMEKTIYKTKSGKFRILLSSCIVLGIVWDKTDIYVAIGCFIFNYERRKVSNIKLITLLLLLVVIITSCSRNGYGCHGRDSWNKTVKRINKHY